MSQGNETTEIDINKIEEPTVGAAGSSENHPSSNENEVTTTTFDGEYSMERITAIPSSVTAAPFEGTNGAAGTDALADPVARVVSEVQAAAPIATPAGQPEDVSTATTSEKKKINRRSSALIPDDEKARNVFRAAKAAGVPLTVDLALEYIIKGVVINKDLIEEIARCMRRYKADIRDVLDDHIPEPSYVDILRKYDRLVVALATKVSEVMKDNDALLRCNTAQLTELTNNITRAKAALNPTSAEA